MVGKCYKLSLKKFLETIFYYYTARLFAVYCKLQYTSILQFAVYCKFAYTATVRFPIMPGLVIKLKPKVLHPS